MKHPALQTVRRILVTYGCNKMAEIPTTLLYYHTMAHCEIGSTSKQPSIGIGKILLSVCVLLPAINIFILRMLVIIHWPYHNILFIDLLNQHQQMIPF